MKKTKSLFPIIIITVVVLFFCVGGFFMLRIKLLQTQLDQGNSFLASEQYDQAIAAYEKGLKIYPKSADAYLGLAQSQIGKGDLESAVDVLNKGIEKTKSENLEASKNVILDQIFATYVLNSYMVNIMSDETKQMSVINKSTDMGFDVTWSVEDTKIADIDENGLVSAKEDGTTNIIATIGNDTLGYKDIEATLVVGIMTTYLQEAGCDYVSPNSNVKALAFTYQEESDGMRKYDGTLEVEQQDAVYKFTECTQSDPDAEGKITYEINYDVKIPYKFGILPNSPETKQAWYYNNHVADWFLCDEYTGQVFTLQSLYGDENPGYDSLVTWNDNKFHVTGTFAKNGVEDSEWTTEYDEETEITWASATADATYTITVSAPARYQGLVLALDKNGVEDYMNPDDDSEYKYDPDATITDLFFFDKQDDGTVRKAEDFYVVRLTDLCK